MRLVIISDTHGYHDKVVVPDGDTLIHCGDLTDDVGKANLRLFLRWWNKLPHKHKIFIAGNHDGAFERWPTLARAMVKEEAPTSHYLQDSGVEIDGLKFWGSPYTPEFYNWYFNVPRGKLHKHWGLIPNGTDVLVTHGPPYGILDVSGFNDRQDPHVGCKELYAAVERVKPMLHCFGHIHHSYGTRASGLTTFVNASICNEAYKPINHPFIYELCPPSQALGNG